jgi:hypothetical protein
MWEGSASYKAALCWLACGMGVFIRLVKVSCGQATHGSYERTTDGRKCRV